MPLDHRHKTRDETNKQDEEEYASSDEGEYEREPRDEPTRRDNTDVRVVSERHCLS